MKDQKATIISCINVYYAYIVTSCVIISPLRMFRSNYAVSEGSNVSLGSIFLEMS
jgi:hypothetical protein